MRSKKLGTTELVNQKFICHTRKKYKYNKQQIKTDKNVPRDSKNIDLILL